MLEAFDPLVGPGTVAVCIASMAGHLMQPPPEALAALDDPLSGAVFDLADDSGHAYVLAKRGVCSQGASYMTGCDVLVDGGSVVALTGV